jgi:hypothetical protein
VAASSIDSIVVFVLALVLASCGPAPAPLHHVGLDGATRFLDLGTGETALVPLTDGGTIELIYGPQGGWHVWASVGIYGIDPQDRVIRYTATSTDGTVLASAGYALMTRNLVADGDGWLRLGDRVIFDGITGPSDVVGRTIVLRATLEESPLAIGDAGAGLDAGVVLASAEHTVTIVDDMP